MSGSHVGGGVGVGDPEGLGDAVPVLPEDFGAVGVGLLDVGVGLGVGFGAADVDGVGFGAAVLGLPPSTAVGPPGLAGGT